MYIWTSKKWARMKDILRCIYLWTLLASCGSNSQNWQLTCCNYLINMFVLPVGQCLYDHELSISIGKWMDNCRHTFFNEMANAHSRSSSSALFSPKVLSTSQKMVITYPEYHFLPRIPGDTHLRLYMLSLTEHPKRFGNNALWDTLNIPYSLKQSRHRKVTS